MRRLLSFVALVSSFACPELAAAQSKEACVDAATHGQTRRDEGSLLEARASFLQCAAEACPAPVREDCARWANETSALVPHVVLGARDAGGADLTRVRVELDGRPFVQELDGRPLPVDPGPHRLRFEDESGLEATVSVVLRAGEGPRVVVATLAPPPHERAAKDEPAPPRGRPLSSPTIPMLAFGGAAIVASVTGSALVAYAYGEKNALEGQCAPRCTDTETAPLRRSLVAANIALGASLVSLAGLIYVVVAKGTASSPPRAAGFVLAPVAMPGGGGASAQLRWH